MVDVSVAYHISPYFYKSHTVMEGFCYGHWVTGSLARGHTVTNSFWMVTDFVPGHSSKYGTYWSDHPLIYTSPNHVPINAHQWFTRLIPKNTNQEYNSTLPSSIAAGAASSANTRGEGYCMAGVSATKVVRFNFFNIAISLDSRSLVS